MTGTDLPELAPDALARIEEARRAAQSVVHAARADGDQIRRSAVASAIGSDSDLFSFAGHQADSFLVQGQSVAMIRYFDVMAYEYFLITLGRPEFEILIEKLSARATREFPGDPIALESRRREWKSRALGRSTVRDSAAAKINDTFWHDLRTQFLALACPHLFGAVRLGWWSLGGLPSEPFERETLQIRFDFIVDRAVSALGFTDRSLAVAVWLDLLVATDNPHYLDGCINNLGEASAEYCAICVQSKETKARKSAGRSTNRKPEFPASKWEEIEILFFNEHSVQLKVGETSTNCDFAALGMANLRTGKPLRAWLMLQFLALQSGVMTTPPTKDVRWTTVEKRMQELRAWLRRVFGAAGDPLPFANKNGYRAAFRIGCAPSYRQLR
jgi:hypothetical protein